MALPSVAKGMIGVILAVCGDTYTRAIRNTRDTFRIITIESEMRGNGTERRKGVEGRRAWTDERSFAPFSLAPEFQTKAGRVNAKAAFEQGRWRTFFDEKNRARKTFPWRDPCPATARNRCINMRDVARARGVEHAGDMKMR